MPKQRIEARVENFEFFVVELGCGWHHEQRWLRVGTQFPRRMDEYEEEDETGVMVRFWQSLAC